MAITEKQSVASKITNLDPPIPEMPRNQIGCNAQA
jgi:hypothetical protein